MVGRNLRRHCFLLKNNLVSALVGLMLISMSVSCASLADGLGRSSFNSTGMCSEMLPGAYGWTFRANEFLIGYSHENNGKYNKALGVFPSSILSTYEKCEYINKVRHTVVGGGSMPLLFLIMGPL